MEHCPHKLFFNDSIVSVYLNNGYTETRYDDETFVPAMPNYDPPSLFTARDLGYGQDTRLMTIHHEILHTFLCEECGLPHSPTLWSVAHVNNGQGCIPLERQYEEEALVLSFQKYLNTRELDPVLHEFAERNPTILLRNLKRKASALLDFTFQDVDYTIGD